MKKYHKLTFCEVKQQVVVELKEKYEPLDLKTGVALSEEPLAAKQSEGKVWLDLARLQDPFNFALSARAISILEAANLKGWSKLALSIAVSPNPYFVFQSLGRCGELLRPENRGFVTGMAFDPEKWDGSDIFTPEGTAIVLLTEAARAAFESLKLPNLEIERLNEAKWYNTGK